ASVMSVYNLRVGIARQIEQRVEEHGGVAGGEDEAVAVRPVRRLRIVMEEFGPEDEGHVGHPHRRSGVARPRLLDGVDGEEADGVDAELFELVLRSDLRLVAFLGDGDRGARLVGGIARVLLHSQALQRESDYTRRIPDNFSLAKGEAMTNETVTVKGSPVRSLQKFIDAELTAEQRGAGLGSRPGGH